MFFSDWWAAVLETQIEACADLIVHRRSARRRCRRARLLPPAVPQGSRRRRRCSPFSTMTSPRLTPIRKLDAALLRDGPLLRCAMPRWISTAQATALMTLRQNSRPAGPSPRSNSPARPAMPDDRRLEQFAAMTVDGCQRSGFIDAHQPVGEPRQRRGENGGQSSLQGASSAVVVLQNSSVFWRALSCVADTSLEGVTQSRRWLPVLVPVPCVGLRGHAF